KLRKHIDNCRRYAKKRIFLCISKIRRKARNFSRMPWAFCREIATELSLIQRKNSEGVAIHCRQLVTVETYSIKASLIYMPGGRLSRIMIESDSAMPSPLASVPGPPSRFLYRLLTWRINCNSQINYNTVSLLTILHGQAWDAGACDIPLLKG